MVIKRCMATAMHLFYVIFYSFCLHNNTHIHGCRCHSFQYQCSRHSYRAAAGFYPAEFELYVPHIFPPIADRYSLPAARRRKRGPFAHSRPEQQFHAVLRRGQILMLSFSFPLEELCGASRFQIPAGVFDNSPQSLSYRILSVRKAPCTAFQMRINDKPHPNPGSK